MESNKKQFEDQQKKFERAEKNAERVQQEMNRYLKLAKETYQATEKLHTAIQDRPGPTERHKCKYPFTWLISVR